MIISDQGKVKIEGKPLLIKAELATLIHALSAHMEKEEILHVVNDGLKSEEEIDKQVEAIAKAKDDFVKALLEALT